MCFPSELPAEAIQTARRFLEILVGRPAEELGELLVDQVRYWRFKNQVRILQKAQNFLREASINPQKVPLKILIPILVGGSLEEDEAMSDKWAALLATGDLPPLIDFLRYASPFAQTKHQAYRI